MTESFDLKYWAGTEQSFAVYLMCLKAMIEGGGDKLAAMYGYDTSQPETKDETPPRLFSQVGDVAVIKIAGSLVNNDDRWNKYYGITGYPEIREALVYAAKRPEIGAILLDVASGGGAVAGVFDTAQLITTIDKKVKPVHTFSGATIASAAYLMGVAARTINIDQMTEAGSIGVVQVHQEISRMLKDMGITATVLRSGKYKALGNQFEPLSEVAKAEFQEQLTYLDGIFEKHVADHRGTSQDVVHEKMGQGRTFIGERALQAGLVDSVTSFDKLLSKIQGGIDSAKQRSKYGPSSTNNNKGLDVSKTLTEQEIAALAEGGATAAAPAPGAQAAAPAPAAPAPATQAEGAPPAAAPAPAAAAPAAQEPSALQVVQGQLSAAQAQVTTLTIELRDLRAAHDAVKGSHASMRAIAVASVQRLKVAMNQTAGGEEALDDTALLAAHDTLRTAFESKFKVGGVAAVATGTGSDAQAGGEELLREARIQATRLK